MRNTKLIKSVIGILFSIFLCFFTSYIVYNLDMSDWWSFPTIFCLIISIVIIFIFSLALLLD